MAAAASLYSDGINTATLSSDYAVWDLGDVMRFHISAESEDIIVQKGGTSFQIGVSKESRENYLLEDDMHVITEDFEEREIVLQQKDGLDAGTVYSSSIIITVPDRTSNVLITVNTTSGNISVDSSHADKMIVASETGAITITNSFVADYIIAESVTGTVTLINTTSDGEITFRIKTLPVWTEEKIRIFPKAGIRRTNFWNSRK